MLPDAVCSPCFGWDDKNSYFCSSLLLNMKQKQAIIEALKRLGGKAKMSRICELALTLGDFSGSKNPKATIRNCIYTHPLDFISSEQKDYWQLASYQEEVEGLKREIEELKGQLAMKDKTIEELKAVKTEDDFVQRIVRETKRLYKHEKEKTEVIRQILYKVGRSDAEEELDAWIEGRQYKPSFNVAGDYVVSKNVENEVLSVASGGTGINISKEK